MTTRSHITTNYPKTLLYPRGPALLALLALTLAPACDDDAPESAADAPAEADPEDDPGALALGDEALLEDALVLLHHLFQLAENPRPRGAVLFPELSELRAGVVGQRAVRVGIDRIAHGVERDLAPGEEVENLVLEFKPRPTQDMLVACLWSKWTGPGEPDLLSFAAITDEPPAEVAAAGHDRCIVPIKPENVDAWLNPANASADRLLAILEDRERPYYEHRMAA